MTEILLSNGIHEISAGGKVYARIVPCEGATDSFTPIEKGAWRWQRKTEKPVDHMRMELVLLGQPTFTMVPAVSYNGNGWGDYLEYVGDRDEDGTPWSWASHRVTIPACTYSENEHISIALMAKPNDNNACSLYQTEEGRKHVVIFPEEEKPRTLQRHFWGEPFQGSMEPRCEFEAIIQAVPGDGTKHRYKSLMDFAFRYYGRPVQPPRTAAELEKLSIAFGHFLYQKEPDGFAGFTTGAPWNKGLHGYEKHQHRYEPGFVGQCISMANAFLYDYTKTGDRLKLEMATDALDSWIKHAVLKKGLFPGRIDRHENMWLDYPEDFELDTWKYSEDMLETMRARIITQKKGLLRRDKDGSIYISCNACCLGTGAEMFFEAYDLLQSVGIDKPEYLQLGLDVCDFAMAHQQPNDSFVKMWDREGNVTKKDGTVGAFLCLPLIDGYRHTGNEKYLDSAARAFRFYYSELEEKGFATAGALDTYSIDKESASPLLRVCLKLYDATEDSFYVEAAEKIGWYLTTWMMYYSVDYPTESVIGQMGFDTYGSTAVSTPHNALDQYALRDVLSFKRLYELTGNIQWRERAQVLWYGANQCISDGTLVVNGRLRPAGGQDEAIFHTRWGRAFVPPFMPSQWLPAWPCAFRLEALRWCKDWNFFDEGLQQINGKIN